MVHSRTELYGVVHSRTELYGVVQSPTELYGVVQVSYRVVRSTGRTELYRCT